MVVGHSKRTNLDELHSGAIRDSTKLVSYNFQMDGDGVGRLNLSNINDTTDEFVRYLVNSNDYLSRKPDCICAISSLPVG